ncbi:uncharacterized protein [Dermacentor andersoni]|uniref:uncharacterized protein n=1 Tax=Dermacentor andersoni TaxID=34620 RepID=UPI003B3AD1C0
MHSWLFSWFSEKQGLTRKESASAMSLFFTEAVFCRTSARRAVMMLDTTSARVQASKHCPVLNGYFYIGTQNIWLLRSVWYFRRDIPRWIVTEFDKRVLWLAAMPSRFMRDEEVYPHGTSSFLESNRQDRSSAYQPLRFEDLRVVFILMGYVLATSTFFLLVEFIVYGVVRCTKCLKQSTGRQTSAVSPNY